MHKIPQNPIRIKNIFSCLILDPFNIREKVEAKIRKTINPPIGIGIGIGIGIFY